MLLEAENISKRFGTFEALVDVSLHVPAGEVHGLLGANGAGKSTLINVLSGAIVPDSGTLKIDGLATPLGSIRAGQRAGLAVVHQELMLFSDRSVEENVFAGAVRSRFAAPISRAKRAAVVENALRRLAPHVDPRRRVSDLSLSEQQLVEIARALCAGGRILILDEPTSSLSQQEADGLFAAIRSLVAGQAGVILVSHRLDEVFAITDMITVLRDGRVVGTWPTVETDLGTVTKAMVGRLADEHRPRSKPAGRGTTALSVRGSSARLTKFDMSLYPGEIVGLAGIEGSGASELLEILGGVRRFDGVMKVSGNEIKASGPADALRAGVVFMPPDRKKGGLWLDRSVAANVGVAAVNRMARLERLTDTMLNRVTLPKLAEVGVGSDVVRQAAGNLSGGNQQRVLLARTLESRPRVLLLSDFTRGVDVGAKAAIHRLVRGLAANGIAICLTSSDLDELLMVADRIVCMSSGHIIADRPNAAFDSHSLLSIVAQSGSKQTTVERRGQADVEIVAKPTPESQ